METKPGIRTTEFWLAAGVSIGNALNLFGVWDFASNWHSGILITVTACAYALARGIAKANVKPDAGG